MARAIPRRRWRLGEPRANRGRGRSRRDGEAPDTRHFLSKFLRCQWRCVSEALKTYRCRSTFGDRYGAEWVVQAFRKCGINYRPSERDRSSIYLDALPLFTTGRARLLDNKRLVQQFASLERRTSSVGKDRVDHGPAGADDACNSAAGAMVLAA